MRNLLGLALLASVVSLSGCQAWNFSAKRTTQHTAPAPMGKLIVEGTNGTINIQGADVDALTVVATQKAYGATQESADAALEEIQILIEESGDDVRVFAVTPKLFKGSISFDITLPQSPGLQAKTSNGDVTVKDVHGAVAVKTSNGKVFVSESLEGVAAETSNGAIEVTSSSPVPLNLETSNGGIKFTGTLSGTDNSMKTSNGAISCKVNGGRVEVRASTSNGSITVDGQKLKKGEVVILGDGESEPAILELRSSNGSITVSNE
jgi:DUF4097 and DUF4098 domain-containing protein YvlB